MIEDPSGNNSRQEVPFDRMRAAIARRMTQSVTTKPRVTLHSWATVDHLIEQKGQLEAEKGLRLPLTFLLARVTAHALATNNYVNGWVQEETIVRLPVVNLGVAVQTKRGLITPVLEEADSIPFPEFATRLAELIKRAQERKLHPKELSNGTFTLSNLGGNLVVHFTPIINPPQLAILGVGRLDVQPHWDGTTWLPSRRIPLSLTFDHAAIDGQPAAEFFEHLIIATEICSEDIWR